METDDENKGKPYDEISELLKKHYKSDKEADPDIFTQEVLRKIDSLFHKEIFSDNYFNEKREPVSDEERYWSGLREYLNNTVSSLKHKTITDHLLKCKDCRKNYTQLMNKKKASRDMIDYGSRVLLQC
ncbi:MAG: hypothetical protein A3I68_07905 [Candidatus Melainabacteria bacterium RIFCSPLOWO2_02_FULL_35_15]|nr:MAG: hypothetical protein A3F80_02625 [Candidatus Melainabacteria bacterium RIFCSPLOWO2_12_FULL_35_11]OGI14214.1 MAG: hypothetical protein A3I68_07905 [Candidatus Melainabacteria bacterium RIFCSPLOWO2_02_FULL_35_15]